MSLEVFRKLFSICCEQKYKCDNLTNLRNTNDSHSQSQQTSSKGKFESNNRFDQLRDRHESSSGQNDKQDKVNDTLIHIMKELADISGRLIETGKCALSQKTCLSDATKLWNNAPVTLKDCTSLAQIKVLTKNYVKSLPF